MHSKEAIVFAVLRTQDVVRPRERLATTFRSSESATEVATPVAERDPVLSKVAALAELGDSWGGLEFGDLVVELHRLVFPGSIVALQAVYSGPLAVDGGLHSLAVTVIAWCLWGRWSFGSRGLRNQVWSWSGGRTPREEHSSKADGGDEFGKETHCGWYVWVERRCDVV